MHNVPKGSETHFKVVVVADAFQDMKVLQVQIVLRPIVAFFLFLHCIRLARAWPRVATALEGGEEEEGRHTGTLLQAVN